MALEGRLWSAKVNTEKSGVLPLAAGSTKVCSADKEDVHPPSNALNDMAPSLLGDVVRRAITAAGRCAPIRTAGMGHARPAVSSLSRGC